MTRHAGEGRDFSNGGLRVLDGQQRSEGEEKILPIYDATTFVGLRTTVRNGAVERIESNGEPTIELPKLLELMAAASIVRCLNPIKLRGAEIRTLRKIMKLTMADLAKEMDVKTAAETISRWESENQPMGAYAEKVLRLIVCEKLKIEAPGVDYNARMIANLQVIDPWKANADYEVPAVDLWYGPLKDQCSGKIIEAWNGRKAA
jgi:transcriptional regulator with XRE-family HTH domain